MKRSFSCWITLLLLMLSVSSKAQDVISKIDSIVDEDGLYDQEQKLAKDNIITPAYVRINKNEVVKVLESLPSFGMFHDNYFITGIPTDRKIDKNTADAKFQISIRQRLIKKVLPFQSVLFLTYTQKSFWDIYANSSPFADNNYNPGFSLEKAILVKDKLYGTAVFAIEHESNGKDGDDSRSWNYLTLSLSYYFNARFTAHLKGWYGWVDVANPDLLKYKGYGLFALNYKSANERFWFSGIFNPHDEFRKCNITLEANYRTSSKLNQYIFIQFYRGYAESMLDYKSLTSMIRFGICIKPRLRSIY